MNLNLLGAEKIKSLKEHFENKILLLKRVGTTNNVILIILSICRAPRSHSFLTTHRGACYPATHIATIVEETLFAFLTSQ